MKRSFIFFLCLIIFSACLLYLSTNFDLDIFASEIKIPEINFSRMRLPQAKNLTDILQYIEKGVDYIVNLPPSPYILGENKKGPKFLGNETCAPFPSIYNIKFNNVIWQIQEQTDWTFYLFGAYWDIRSTNKDAPSIRILGMMNRMDEAIETNYCQIWFENYAEPLIAKINNYQYVWVKKWGNYNNVSLQPYLMNCPMPANYTGAIPTSVSVVPTPCTPATNNLRVYFDNPKEKKMFGVCVKGMDFLSPDLSIRLVEWIEMLHIFGVDKIYFYELAVHPNVKKVLEYYENLNKIQVFPLTNAGTTPNEPYLRHAFLKKKVTHKRQHELIPYNDCLYRNMYKYKFISLLDIDEIIVPHNEASTWIDLADLLEKNSTDKNDYFVFANVHFVNDEMDSSEGSELIPTHLHMLQHTTRETKDAGRGSGIKCFHRPENILTLHNHFPTSCISKCQRKFVDPSDGILQHYNIGRRMSNGNVTFTYITDQTLWRWKDELIARSNQALHDLNLIL